MQFNKGLLYFRIEDGEIGDLFYTTETIEPEYGSFHVENIADMRYHESGEPCFCGFTECAGPGELTGSGMLVNFRAATDADLHQLFAAWNHTHSLTNWLENVDAEEHLADAEKKRLRQIAAPYLKK